MQPGVAWRGGGRRGGRGGDGPEPTQVGVGFSGMAEVLRRGPAGGPARRCDSRHGHAGGCKRVVWVVVESVVGGGLQGERLVKPVSGEVAVIGGSEVKPVGSYPLLRGQVPPAVGTGAGRGVLVLRAHGDGLAAIEAALRQGAHVLF